MGPYAIVDYNRTLCRLQHIYNGQPYTRVDFIAQSWNKNFSSVILKKNGNKNEPVSFFLLLLDQYRQSEFFSISDSK